MQRIARLGSRLRRMSAEEIGQRLALKLRGLPAGKPYFERRDKKSSLALAQRFWISLADDPVGHVTQTFEQHFFLGPCDRVKRVACIEKSAPEHAANVIAAAKALRGDGLALLGTPLSLTREPIDWLADPISGKQLWDAGSIDEATAIANPGGDVKFVWEWNRHQFLVTSARAYWLTGDESFAEDVVRCVVEWIQQNPVGSGVNWCSHLEVAMRSISWLWALALIIDARCVNTSLLERWLKSLAAHYVHLARNLSTYTDPTNHLIGEATALWLLGLLFPTLEQAEANEQRAAAILIHELERQMSPDGVNLEQASSYHRFVLDFYLQFTILSRRVNRALSPEHEALVARMVTFAARLGGRSGIAPGIGDADDARGVPFLELTGWDFRDVVVTGSLLFQDIDTPSAPVYSWAGALWLLGEPYRDPDDRRGKRNASGPMISQGGYHFLPLRHAQTQAELIFKSSPFGLQPNAAHAHSDALSIVLRDGEAWILVDSGTGTYFQDPDIRDRFRATACHNTASVDGLDQADIFDVFKWINPPSISQHRRLSRNGFHYVSASHTGYLRLTSPVIHRRTVATLPDFGWVVFDTFDGNEQHALRQFFNFAPSIGLSLHASLDQGGRADGPTGSWSIETLTGDDTITTSGVNPPGLYSNGYGHWEETPRLTVSSTANLPITLATLLTPTGPDETNKRPSGYRCHYSDGKLIVLTREDRELAEREATECIVFNPERQKIRTLDNITTNAEFLRLELNGEQMPTRLSMVGAGAELTANRFSHRCDMSDELLCIDVAG